MNDAAVALPPESDSDPFEADAATAAAAESDAPDGDGEGEATRRTPTEADRIAAAVRALKTRGTPHQVRARLIAAGCDPDQADKIVNRARSQLLADSRKLGARIAEVTVAAMCASLLLLFVPGGEVFCGILQIVGMVVLAVAFLVWLSGVGGD
ncbi:hypothetical protein [Alienimonas californiensis]|uniref:Uncharacterized protein n=1 Tax=Alienimonas californiensis TaxID=2527989 RepID=A0A517PA99_9PLAN|nr:hypothetical protein [Alienimonas californiensis]QDT16307.1 hypothetical protein CA12_24080 [Alienimonas californiensis]